MSRVYQAERTFLPTLSYPDKPAPSPPDLESSHHSHLSIEFTLLRFNPAPWQPADSLQWAKMMGWGESSNWETEIIRARIVDMVGAERAARLEAGYDPGHPLILPPGVDYQGINLDLLEQYEAIKHLSGFGMLGASNSWVVDGSMTVTGAPILCNDPHLGQAAPSIWYECHLVAGDLDVIGASFPGTPGITIGHNQHIAWGLTNAISDVEDLYLEKFHPQNPSQYEYQGTWEAAQVIREEITVKGSKAPVIEEVRITRHGPILTSISRATFDQLAEQDGVSGGGRDQAVLERLPEARQAPLALRWTGLEPCTILTAVQKMNRASNWEEFREALRDWDVPPQNIIYADSEGNIGYVMAGAIPIRARGQALLPSPGWTGEYEWTGCIPFEALPQTYNPPQHFIVTANNRVVNDEYPYYITNEWLNGYRAQRIRDLLTGKAAGQKLTLADMASIQADHYALPDVAIVPHLVKIATEVPLEVAALNIVRAWDYVLEPFSVGAVIYATFLRKLERMVFGALLGEDETLLDRYLGAGSTLLSPVNRYISRSRPLLIRELDAHDDSWFADSAMPDCPSTWDAALSSAFHRFLRGGHPSCSRDWEEPRPPFAYRFRPLEKELMGMQQKRAYLYRCYPTPSQRQMLARTFGCVRFVYNWGLRLRTDTYRERGEHVYYSDTSAALTQLKGQPAYDWLNAVSSVPPQQALRHLDKAFRNFFDGRAKYPTFKKKRGRQSAEYTTSAFTWDGSALTLARMPEPLPIRWSRPLPKEAKPTTITLSRDPAGRYFVSFLVIEDIAPLPSVSHTVGIDLGLEDVVTLSTGEKTGNEHFFRQEEQHLARAQRRHAKKQKGSKNQEKARRKMARLHAREAFRRRDFQHKLTTRLIRENQVVCVESLAIENMLKNHCLAKAISDVGWGELLRQLEYKASWYGRTLVAINRWYPSSKRCSVCGHELEILSLAVREWTCPRCGAVHDRDVNAACNTKAEGLSVFACGEAVRPNLNGTREGTPRRSRKSTSREVESHPL